MPEKPSALEWARLPDLGGDLSWGFIENQVLTHEPVPSRTPAWAYAAAAVSWIVAPVLLVPIVGSPAIGLGLLLVVLGRPESGTSDGLARAATLAFGLTFIVLVASLRAWWVEGRRRNLLFAGYAGLALVCSVVAITASITTGQDRDLTVLKGLTAASTAAALVTLVLTVRSRPAAPSRKPPRRGPRGNRRWRRHVDTREQVLDILMHRGLVHLDDADRTRMNEMPLGYWEELDGVDDRERRRILELRSVGWRQFDDGDRRPWPPSTA